MRFHHLPTYSALPKQSCKLDPEDEGVIAQLMSEFPDFEVVPLPQFPGFTNGKPEWMGLESSLGGTVRLFPHRLRGEGHFACLLQRRLSTDIGTGEQIKSTDYKTNG